METFENKDSAPLDIESIIEDAKQKLEDHLREVQKLAAAHMANKTMNFDQDLEEEEDRGVALISEAVAKAKSLGEMEGARRAEQQGELI